MKVFPRFESLSEVLDKGGSRHPICAPLLLAEPSKKLAAQHAMRWIRWMDGKTKETVTQLVPGHKSLGKVEGVWF